MNTTKKPSRRDRVYQQLSELTQQMTPKRIETADFRDHDAAGIGKSLNITINNTCMELNALVKDGLVVKILGRPVYFFAREDLEQVVGRKISQCIWDNYGQFRELLNRDEAAPAPAAYRRPAIPAAPPAMPVGKGFLSLVGANQSLKKCIEQAKAAVLYPPNGLHTLITGETGTGKSHFAEAMYDFAVETGRLKPEAKFVIYNCANYSENPQLLLSQLFGYKKGAFTGADRDTPGIIDQADGGVLFLDEAHRLSPEGQEKMFLLIDKGIFQRLGETREYRTARIRIIAATTEDPQGALLSTFLRRIPTAIHIPPLAKRSFDERLHFVFRFLWEESRNIQMAFELDQEVIRSLTLYRCRGNIGQIRSDIRCLCASAYMEHYCTGKTGNTITVELTHLPDNVENGLYDVTHTGGPLFQRYRFCQDATVRIDAAQGGYERFLQPCNPADGCGSC